MQEIILFKKQKKPARLKKVMIMKEINQKNVLMGYKIKELRLKGGYTQAKVADILGVSAQHYGTLERGTNSLSLDNIMKLCDFYSVSLMSILGDLRKADRKQKKKCEKLANQIEELGEEHKEVITHMVKFYRQLERKALKASDNQKEEESENKQFEQEVLKENNQVEKEYEDKEFAKIIKEIEGEMKEAQGGKKTKAKNKGASKKRKKGRKKKVKVLS